VARLERQRALAVKEVEYLRLQLNSFDIEDAAFTPETHNAARGQRIAELEAIVDRYKDEVQALHAELLAAERQQQQPSSSSSPPHADIPPGSKRPRGEGAADVSAPPPAQLRALQDEAAALKAALALAQRDLASAHAQLAQLRESSKTRILALKSNPTADHEAVKRAALATLRRENADLLALARGQDPRSPTVPASVLDAALLDLDAARAHAASVEKTTRRLKEVWAAKSHEFREAVASTLGWSVSFMPNGKMRVESMYLCPPEGDAAGEDADEHANSIVFDGERGTMKVGGGPRSPFAARIAEQIGFWVRERGCVPGLLAALTIEFYEERMAREGR
jgi:mitotic spindle assembly checkpoint protein MAD1